MSFKEFPPDEFTESDVLNALHGAGLKHKNLHRYIVTQCPTHEDRNPSTQIFKNDWFVNCFAGCGRYHITKAFPELRPQRLSTGSQNAKRVDSRMNNKNATTGLQMPKYKHFNELSYWQSLPLIPRDHEFKGLPLETLDDMGWRWVAEKNSYYIPYFSSSKTSIPFSQLRHLSGPRRFTFLYEAEPTMYGTWNLLLTEKIFLVEGASDAAVLDFCGVPWIAAPSAASKELVKKLGKWCKEHDVTIVFAGDNDDAGEQLRYALDEVTSYRVKQPPAPYKDWGEYYLAEGIQAVVDYCYEEINPTLTDNATIKEMLGLMGGGTVYETTGGDKEKGATQTSSPPRLL